MCVSVGAATRNRGDSGLIEVTSGNGVTQPPIGRAPPCFQELAFITNRPAPPYPEQQQSMPGITAAMNPRPDHGETSYVGMAV